MSEHSSARDVTDGERGAGAGGSAQEAVDPSGGVESTAGDARVVGLDSADADAIMGAVASDTARTVLEALHEEPATTSALSDRVDLSLQTVQYHLGNLADAGLVEVVDTDTSEKGREMDVYGPVHRPVVVFAGDEDDTDDLRAALSRLVSGVVFLGLASLLVRELLAGAERSTGSAVSMSAETADSAGSAAGVDPGLVFFAGGLVVLAAYLAGWYLRRQGTLDGVLPGA